MMAPSPMVRSAYQRPRVASAGKSGDFTGKAQGARICLVCGCTETTACIDDRGPCLWAGQALCSHCADANPSAKLCAHILTYAHGRSEIGLATLAQHLLGRGHADERIGGKIATVLRTLNWMRDGWLAMPDGPTPRWVRRYSA